MRSRDEIVELTSEYGGAWAVNHSRRIIHMVSVLAEGRPYNEEVIWMAAYLHDWGAYTKFALAGVEHFLRSKEVAQAFLDEHEYPEDLADGILECVEFHHGGAPHRRFESILFTDADALDLLGVVGTLRIFSMMPRDLRGAYERVQSWRDMSIAALRLEKSRTLAARRVAETDLMLRTFEEETFGLF